MASLRWLLAISFIPLCQALDIAIVGAGIGGASLSVFLRESLGFIAKVNIHVFEAAEEVGGRTADLRHDGKIFEAGASVIYTGRCN